MLDVLAVLSIPVSIMVFIAIMNVWYGLWQNKHGVRPRYVPRGESRPTGLDLVVGAVLLFIGLVLVRGLIWILHYMADA